MLLVAQPTERAKVQGSMTLPIHPHTTFRERGTLHMVDAAVSDPSQSWLGQFGAAGGCTRAATRIGQGKQCDGE